MSTALSPLVSEFETEEQATNYDRWFCAKIQRTLMTHTTLISVDQLHSLQASAAPLMVFDCTFDLMRPDAGLQQYAEAHIPGAVYAHLDTALSDKSGTADAASGGRHPLPSREKFAAWLSSVGFTNTMQAVVYDRNGVNYCGRLWWMLKWAGHDAVAVLDGGLQAWTASGGEVVQGVEAHLATPLAPSKYTLSQPLRVLTAIETVASGIGKAYQTIIDARATPRFKGEVEPLDPIAGHIPGALNRPFNLNIGADGKFKPAALLKTEFEALLGGRNPSSVVHHCGSGVSAVPNVLAMEIAGLGQAALFAGSWSEWSNTAGLPVAQG
jgi:thiosulfate/3-mercaptopyruvate sulfurtransferase